MSFPYDTVIVRHKILYIPSSNVIFAVGALAVDGVAALGNPATPANHPSAESTAERAETQDNPPWGQAPVSAYLQATPPHPSRPSQPPQQPHWAGASGPKSCLSRPNAGHPWPPSAGPPSATPVAVSRVCIRCVRRRRRTRRGSSDGSCRSGRRSRSTGRRRRVGRCRARSGRAPTETPPTPLPASSKPDTGSPEPRHPTARTATSCNTRRRSC